MEKDPRFKTRKQTYDIQEWLIAHMKEVRERGGDSYNRQLMNALIEKDKLKRPK